MQALQDLRQNAAAGLGIALSEAQLEQFSTYLELLLEWNAHTNLTAIREPGEIVEKHFLDALTCTLAFDGAPESLIDIGTGAGFPGLPLKFLYPEMMLTLVDSVGKKTEFLDALVARLGLTDVTVLNDRAEALGQHADHRERYQWACARAVAQLPTLLELTLPLVRVGGGALLQKGVSAEAELAESDTTLAAMGGALDRLIPVELPQLSPRFLVSINKTAATPARYPRRVGVPAKRPL